MMTGGAADGKIAYAPMTEKIIDRNPDVLGGTPQHRPRPVGLRLTEYHVRAEGWPSAWRAPRCGARLKLGPPPGLPAGAGAESSCTRRSRGIVSAQQQRSVVGHVQLFDGAPLGVLRPPVVAGDGIDRGVTGEPLRL